MQSSRNENPSESPTKTHMTLWTDERRELQEQLFRLDPELSALYENAITLLSEEKIPGKEHVRLSMIGHCVRELINLLPDALKDVEGMLLSGWKDNNAETEKLIGSLEEEAGGDIGNLVSDETDNSGQARRALITQRTLNAMAEWAKSEQEKKVRERQRDSVTVLGSIDSKNPALIPWGKARKFFMRRTHIKRSFPLHDNLINLPGDTEVLYHLSAIEACLRVRLCGFFDIYDEINDLLEDANMIREKDDIE